MATIMSVDSGITLLKNEISERIPPITTGLRDYFPLDITTTGINGTTPVNATEVNFDLLNGFCYDYDSTNIWAPTTAPWGWTTNYQGTVSRLYDTPYPRGVRLYKPPEASAHGSLGHWHGSWGASLMAFVTGTTYCISCWYRKASPKTKTPIIECMKNDWTGTSYTTIAYYHPPATYDWQRCYKVFTMTADATAKPYIYFDYDRDLTIDVCGMQLEILSYPSAYTDSSRTANSELRYALNPNLANGMTFAFNYSTRYAWDSMQPAQAYDPMLFELGNYYGNASFSLWTISKNNILAYVKGNTGSGWQIGGQVIRSLTEAWWDNQTHNYIIVFYSANGTGFSSYAVYVDGVKSGPFTISPEISTFAGNWYGTNDPHFGGMYKNLAVYDRALNDNEVTVLSKWSMQLANPNVRTKSITEAPILDSALNAKILPLRADAETLYGAYSPTVNTGAVFEDASMYVGSATTNLGPNFPTWSSQRSHVRCRTPDGWGIKYVSPSLYSTWSGNSYWYTLINLTVTSGSSYTMSAWCYVSADCDLDWVHLITEANVAGYGSSYDLTKKGTWQRLSFTAVASADGTGRFLTYASKNGVTDGTYAGYFIWGDPQIEVGAYRTPYTSSTRSATDVEFATRDINLDLTGNWTIYGNFKINNRHAAVYNPMITKDDGGVNRTLIMADYTNSSNHLVTWFGDGTNASILGVNQPLENQKWTFFALRRNGSTVTLSIYLNGNLYSTSNALGSYFDAQTNTNNWKIGLWSGQELDGWVKEYGFVQVALTDQQLKDLANGRIRITPDGIKVQELIEGAL